MSKLIRGFHFSLERRIIYIPLFVNSLFNNTLHKVYKTLLLKKLIFLMKYSAEKKYLVTKIFNCQILKKL